MSMSLRTAMQLKCCCAKYPPLYQCNCEDLGRQFVNGFFPTPRLIDMRFNMTSGVCEHFGFATGAFDQAPINQDNCNGNIWPGCETNNDQCYPCCTSGCGSYGGGGQEDCGYEAAMPTSAKTTVPAYVFDPWTWACGHPDNVPFCHGINEDSPNGNAPGMADNWARMWCGPNKACCCQAENGVCYQGELAGGTLNFVEGYLQSFIDGTHKFRAYWGTSGPISYVPDEDYYGEIFMGGEAGSGEEPDELSFGSSPKVGYSARKQTPGYIWYDESTDIAQLWLWYIPPDGWECGVDLSGYIKGIYLDIIGGADHGRHEFLFSSHQTLASLQTAIENLNSGLHVFRHSLGLTELENKMPWEEVNNNPLINNLGCEECLQVPPDFPPPSCTPPGYDWPTPFGGTDGITYKWKILRSVEGAHKRWPAGAGYDASEGWLVMQTSTSSGVWDGGAPIQYHMKADQNHFIKMAIRCFDDGINGRGWETRISLAEPNLYPDWSRPIMSGECASSMESTWWYSAQYNSTPQRHKIVTKNQGECGTSLFNYGYDRWEGNPHKDWLRKVDLQHCDPAYPQPELPLAGSSGWTLDEICDMQNCPGCVLEPDGSGEYGDCGRYEECNPYWWFFQTTAVDVTEWIDYPRIDD